MMILSLMRRDNIVDISSYHFVLTINHDSSHPSFQIQNQINSSTTSSIRIQSIFLPPQYYAFVQKQISYPYPFGLGFFYKKNIRCRINIEQYERYFNSSEFDSKERSNSWLTQISRFVEHINPIIIHNSPIYIIFQIRYPKSPFHI